jgi:hypothetical protein
MDVNGQLCVLATLPTGKESLLPIEYKAGLAAKLM